MKVYQKSLKFLEAYQHEETLSVDLHVFGDASLKDVSAVLYAVVHQKDGRSQAIVAAKSRLSRRILTVSRLELVAAHMATNLMGNTQSALKKYPVDCCYAWTDSTVVLCWLKTKHGYKEFATNRVLKINEKNYIEWRNVPTHQNPTHIESNGCKGNKIQELWTRGPSWLYQLKLWPDNIEVNASEESEAEKRATRENLKAAVQTTELIQHQLLKRHNLKRATRTLAWIRRFINNSRVKEKAKRKKGPLSTNKTEFELMEMIKIYHNKHEGETKFKQTEQQLNFKRNGNGINECHGRIIGDCPIFIPKSTLLAEKLVERAHYQTLPGGVTLKKHKN